MKRRGTGAIDATIRLQRAVKRGARSGTLKRLSAMLKRAFKRFDKALR